MDRINFCLLVLAVLLSKCAGQLNNPGNAEQLPDVDETIRGLLDEEEAKQVDSRKELDAKGLTDTAVHKRSQEVDEPISTGDMQSRSSKDGSISANSASARFPHDCTDVMRSGEKTSGVYTLYVGPLNRPVAVYCDMTTEAGGWTVFQRRKDGSVKFERTWGEYAAGFGNVAGEFWLGNDVLYLMTKIKKYRLRIDMQDWNGNSTYAEYSDFKVAGACDKYKLVSIGAYCGNAGDSLTIHVGFKFSTLDQDNDTWDKSCAVVYKGAWWYGACYHANLNGIYYRGAHTTHADGVNWYHWLGHYYSLKFVEMKIRPIEI